MNWMKYVKPYLPFFIIGPLCMIVEVIGEVVMPRLMAIVINRAEDGTLTNGESLWVMAAMVGVALVMMAGGIGGAYFATKASVGFAADLRADVFARIQAFSFANIDRFSTGSLVTRLTNDITQLQNFIAMLLRMALRAPGMMIAALIMAIALQPTLSVVFAVTMPMMLITIFIIISVGFPRFTAMQTKIDKLNTTVQEDVTNIRVIKSFVREDHEIVRFHEANQDLKDTGLSAMRLMILLQPIMSLFMYGTILAVVLLGGRIVLDGGMQVGDLSSFIQYVGQILGSLVMVTFLLMTSSRALASARRIKEVAVEPLDLTDEHAACPDLDVERGEIEFKNVSFRYYKNSPDSVLHGIDLKIPAGSTVGIIGSTGSGKTTLVSLIPRLYDCDEGQVLVDGVDVRDYSLVRLRDGVGMVLQNNTLFSGSIADNLRWGDEGASDAALADAARYAAADRFIEGLTAKSEIKIEQGGSNVSGGQKQRLCIARALLKKPKILILDDSTSAVDTATEALIRASFREKLPDTTKLIIAQRISSVRDADMIVVMGDGAVTGIGTHEELLASNEEYREIYSSQMGKEA
ncbi:MAG: ABC transporter ATP-binding protein [Lachnospiraceae bacterium]|nr:ABC transporter ATP-binding protein [Lachnospiraceae bacterium]